MKSPFDLLVTEGQSKGLTSYHRDASMKVKDGLREGRGRACIIENTNGTFIFYMYFS